MQSAPRKVLILAYDFPPYVSVGGLRPYSWYKYLRENNIDVTVVTRQWSMKYFDERDYIAAGSSQNTVIELDGNQKIIRSPYVPNWANRLYLNTGESKLKYIRKIYTAFFEFAQYFIQIGSKKEVYKAALKELSETKYDLIIATGDPFVLFHYASKLGSKFNIPWIADYRDPWSNNLRVQKNAFIAWLEKKIERKTIATSSLITTVNNRFVFQIERINPNKAIHIVENGFDNIEFEPKVHEINSVIKIGFAGTLQNEDPLVEILETIIQHNKTNALKIELHFFGSKGHPLMNQYPESFFVRGKVPNDELLGHLNQMNALLLFSYLDIVGTKIYDYIALKKPILFCYTGDYFPSYYKVPNEGYTPILEQEEILKETGLGILCKDKIDLKNQLFKLDEILRDMNSKNHSIDSDIISKYSRKRQAFRLANLIHQVIDKDDNSDRRL